MKILELAKRCDLYATDNSYVLYKKQLEAFAAAVIEEYKTSLVPVAYMSTDENHMEWRKGALLELGFKDNEVKPLYALPKETK